MENTKTGIANAFNLPAQHLEMLRSGGDRNDRGWSLANYKDLKLYTVGTTGSLGNDFPLENLGGSPPAWWQPNNGGAGQNDGYISRFGIAPVIVATSINELTLDEIETLLIYPNPSSGQVNVLYKSEENENIQIEITDILGQTIYIRSFKKYAGLFRHQISLTNVSQSCYIVTIKTKKQQITQKIIVQ